MFRVTTGMMSDSMMNNLRRANRRLDEVQNQIGTGKRAQLPHQDPSGVINTMLYRTRITELQQFQRNLDDGDSRLRFYDTAIGSAGDIMLRLKELTVQSANGTYNQDDRRIMAREVDELLKQMIEIANTQYKGETLFSGFRITDVPFRAIEEKIPGYPHALVNRVEYQGDIGSQLREIEQMQYVGVNMAGNKVFWGDHMRVASTVPGTGYQAAADQVFRLDGVAIEVRAGDTLPVIVQKINDAHIAVHASIDNTRGNNQLVLETTDIHQLWVEDIQGGTVMQDLGIIAQGSNLPPKNWSATARVDGGSMFDIVIDLRNALINNDVAKLGTLHLGNIDRAVRHLARYRGEVGALASRMDGVRKRLATDEVNMTDVLSRTEDVDMAGAITELRMLEQVEKAAMQVGARIIPPTLLDFLR